MGDEQPHPEPARRRWAPMSKIPKSLLSRTPCRARGRLNAQRADPGSTTPASTSERRAIRHGAGPMDPGSAPPSAACPGRRAERARQRSEEHTSELQSLMRNSYAVFCLKIKNTTKETSTQKIKHS